MRLIKRIGVIVRHFRMKNIRSTITRNNRRPTSTRGGINNYARVLNRDTRAGNPTMNLRTCGRMNGARRRDQGNITHNVRSTRFSLTNPLGNERKSNNIVFRGLRLIMRPRIRHLFIIPACPRRRNPRPITPTTLLLSVQTTSIHTKDTRQQRAHRKRGRRRRYQGARQTIRSYRQTDKRPNHRRPRQRRHTTRGARCHHKCAIRRHRDIEVTTTTRIFTLLSRVMRIMSLLAILINVVRKRLLFRGTIVTRLPIRLFPLHTLPIRRSQPRRHRRDNRTRRPHRVRNGNLQIPHIQRLDRRPNQRPSRNVKTSNVHRYPRRNKRRGSKHVFPMGTPNPRNRPSTFLRNRFFFIRATLPSLWCLLYATGDLT